MQINLEIIIFNYILEEGNCTGRGTKLTPNYLFIFIRFTEQRYTKKKVPLLCIL